MTNTLMIKPEDVKRLREMTGAGIMDCKRALEESGGVQAEAARRLNVSRGDVGYKMRKYGLSSDAPPPPE